MQPMDQQKEKPLEGIKVVEYGVFHAGPGGGAILGDQTGYLIGRHGGAPLVEQLLTRADADRLRDEIQAAGFKIVDTKDGQRLERL